MYLLLFLDLGINPSKILNKVLPLPVSFFVILVFILSHFPNIFAEINYLAFHQRFNPEVPDELFDCS